VPVASVTPPSPSPTIAPVEEASAAVMMTKTQLRNRGRVSQAIRQRAKSAPESVRPPLVASNLPAVALHMHASTALLNVLP